MQKKYQNILSVRRLSLNYCLNSQNKLRQRVKIKWNYNLKPDLLAIEHSTQYYRGKKFLKYLHYSFFSNLLIRSAENIKPQ